MNSKARNIFFFIGLTAIVVMCLTFDVSLAVLWQNTRQAGLWMVAIIGLWALLYALNAAAWEIILRGSGECPVSFLFLYKTTITGFALNQATPVGLLGGEPYKILELQPHVGGQRATSSVVLFSMMHIFSHFWFWVTAIIAYLILAVLGYLAIDGIMGIILTLSGLFCLAGIYLFVQGYKYGLTVRLIDLLCRIPILRKFAVKQRDRHIDKLIEIDLQIASLHAQNKRSFYLSLFLEYVGRLLQSLEIFFVMLIFGDAGGVLHLVCAFLILAFTSLFANLLFFFPMQIGGREGGFLMSVAQLGLTAPLGMFIALVCRIRELFWLALGLLLMKVGNRR